MKKIILFITIAFSFSGFSQTWQNDFSNPSDWINTDVNAGTDTWIISSTAIGGDVDSISSASAANGFAQFNSEGQCAGNHQDVTLTYFQPIDLTTNQLSYLQFIQHYKRGKDTLYVEFSNDGLTWESVRVNKDMWYNQQSDDPDTVQVSIPSSIQSQPFYLRFRFQGDCGFAWLIDDLMIFEKDNYKVKTHAEVQINGMKYSEINLCISDTLDLRFVIENFGIDTIYNLVIKTDLDRGSGTDFTRYDTIPKINPFEILDTLLANVITDPFNNEYFDFFHYFYSDSLDTSFVYLPFFVGETASSRFDYFTEGNYVSDPTIIGVGNLYYFAEVYCPVETSIYIPDHPDAEDQLVFLEFFKMVNGNWVFNGFSPDYFVTSSDLGGFLYLYSYIDYPYQPGDTGLVIYGTYGTNFPVPYAQVAEPNSIYKIDGSGNVILEPEGHVIMINLAPLYPYDCEMCYWGINEISEPTLEIFPNPATNQIQIQNLNKPINTIRIFSIDGREVYSQNKLDNQTIPISFLEPGTYLIFIETEDGTIYSEKFVKL